MIKVLGVDPSLASTGVWGGSGSAVIAPKAKGNQRLLDITDSILAYAKGVDVVAIETPVAYTHGSATLALGGLATIIRYRLWDNGIAYADIRPSQRMKWATGKGAASKEQVLLAAARKLGYEGTSHDEADALVLWDLTDVAYNGRKLKKLTVMEQQVLCAVNWPTVRGVEPNLAWPTPIDKRRRRSE